MYIQIPEFDISFEYPDHWIFEKETNKTYLFYNESLGSFRITLLKAANNAYVQQRIKDEYEDNIEFGAIIKRVGSADWVCYKVTATEEENVVIHKYFTGKNEILFVCSYAYDYSLNNTAKIKSELTFIDKLLGSLKFE